MKPLRRLGRHLSFANVLACLALFVALGGGAYAASKTLNGKYIVKHTIGANKLKNGTITSKQVKKNSLDSSVIDLSTLTTVPSAQTAVSANRATTATTADSATTAAKATSAETADRATSAASAESAGHANNAGHADSADTATNSTHATTADDAATVGGESASELTDACPANTELFGGMCWDGQPRPLTSWIGAAIECGNEGGRLPSLSELIAYIAQEGIQAATPQWSSDVADFTTEEQALAASETGRELKAGGTLFKFRCLFYRTNG